MIGKNIRHVVSPIVISNKMTVDFSGGVGDLGVPSLCDVLMYLYTIPIEGYFAKMPRKNQTRPHTPFQFTGSCQNKKRFKNEAEALRAADDQMLTNAPLELAVYKCEMCGGWHLTRQIKKR